MKVSVITAVLNGRDAIPGTLDSVASQDFPAIEHIVVDGGSTDGTLGVVESHGTRVARVVAGPDRGVYDALNKGIAASTGDVIVFLHAGDVYCGVDSLSALLAPLHDPGVEISFADVVITDPDSPCRTLRTYRADAFRPDDLRRGFMPPHPTLAARRRVYDAHGAYDTTYRIAGDFDFSIRVLLKAGVSWRYVPRTVVRMPAGGLSNRGWRSVWLNTLEMKRACDAHDLGTGWWRLAMRLPVKWLDGRRHA